VASVARRGEEEDEAGELFGREPRSGDDARDCDCDCAAASRPGEARPTSVRHASIKPSARVGEVRLEPPALVAAADTLAALVDALPPELS